MGVNVGANHFVDSYKRHQEESSGQPTIPYAFRTITSSQLPLPPARAIALYIMHGYHECPSLLAAFGSGASIC